MEKLPMCRVCLAENVRMYVVVNKNMHELYKRLTDIPFITKDNRPMLVCFYCCTKLKQCCQFQKKCLEAEELFALMMNEDYESKPLINQDHLECFNGLIQSPMVHVSVVDECQTESDDIKEELPAVCEGPDDTIEPKEESKSDELELENLNSGYSDIEDIAAQQSESDLEDDLPLLDIKMEKEQEVPKKKRRASDTQRSPIVKKQKLHIRGRKLKDEIIEEQKKQTDTEVIQNTRNCTSKLIPEFKEPLICKIPRVNIRITNTTLDSCDVISQPRFNQKIKLARHIRIRTGKKPFQCEVCQRCFSDSHICTHTREKPFKCDVCQRCFSRRRNLTSHIRVHTGERPFKCDTCQRCFSHKMSLMRHISTHTGEKPFKCDVCQRCFSCKVSLTSHIRVHTGEKPFKCDVCQRCFNCKVSLTSHIRVHTGEKPFKCDACQRCFNYKISLTRHVRTHTGEKPFKCDACQRCFNYKMSLTRHISTHTGEKPFECDVCQRCFSRKEPLTRHLSTHTGERPFKCDACQSSFNRKATLTRHIRTHHQPFNIPTAGAQATSL